MMIFNAALALPYLASADSFSTKPTEVPAMTDKILKRNVEVLVDWIDKGKGPFSQAYVDLWYNRYLQLSHRV